MDKTQKLEKLLIQCFTKPERTGSPEKSFEARFNPDSYSHRYVNAYNRQQGIGTLGLGQAYAYAGPQEVNFKLIFDASTTYSDSSSENVFRLVQNFLDAAYQSVGEIHAPYYLRLIWGEMNFNCRLETAEATYSGFGPGGQPSRAEIVVAFIGEAEDPTGSKTFNSPDLSHVRTVLEGDSLPLMTERIYGSKQQYTAVAQANGLDSLRQLAPGRQLIFPPLQK
jgi:hypothetical protein